ncbi:MAG TPA: calcium-binding EGF-like domain-containing protein [Saprospiraceae bacterium]|nr:calcium-binding EGF-like domain-containing protein [Saprospiraceae bacterium]
MKISTLIPLFIFLFIFSCKKDPCEGISCLNGGACNDGTCVCPDGYSGQFCEKKVDPCLTLTCLNGGYCENGACKCPPGYYGKNCELKVDPCATVTCLNGGSCVNGLCNCLSGYGGADCSQILTPRTVTITRIDLLKMPQTSNGVAWDLLSGPDIYISIKKSGSTTALYETIILSDINPTLTFVFNSLNFDFNSPKDNLLFELYDDDGLFADELMASASQQIFNNTGFPSFLTITKGDFSIKLTLKYTHN